MNLAIVQAPTTTAFVLSTSVVTYGGESATSITATVTPGFTFGSATGTVTIKAGGTTLCTITLTSGVEQRRILLADQHRPDRSRQPVLAHATYSGDTNFTGSVSSAQTLTVVPAVTTTILTETPPSVVVGQETAATFTPVVTVAPVAAGCTHRLGDGHRHQQRHPCRLGAVLA